MNTRAAISAYTRVGVESGVTAADPHKLISMLFQGALQAIVNAKVALKQHDISAKGSAISQAILIIDEGLKASLDKDVGGALAQNLAALYDYMGARLLEANIKNDEAILDEVGKLLSELKEGWEGIRQPATPAPAPAAAPAPGQQLVYGRA